jgi:two-component system invasion response regulator UvrY
MPIIALVVEDDPLTRVMLESTLSGAGLEVVAVGHADEALAAVELRPVQVAVLDIHLGVGPSGLDLAHELRRRHPGIAIVMLTSLLDPRLAGDGVVELPPRARYLPKSAVTSVDILLGIVRDVLAEVSAEGDGSVEPAERWSRARNDGGKGLRALTDAQIGTLRLVAEGLSNAEIAARRSISERTVEKTVLRMARVLGLAPDASRNQRVHLARVYFRGLDGSAERAPASPPGDPAASSGGGS